MNSPASNESSASARLAAARLKQWHQQGEALLTIENARSFLNAAGLVLFARRPQIAAPAPSFVEAVLGETNAGPTVEQTAPARELLARLVAEGLAVPLNLLGLGSVIGPAGDAPDFIASAQVFSYIFTLRGDKGWKQPPQSAGAVKFSNLATAAYEALTRRGALSAYDLATELGKEVTEGAVLRALGELWSHLRVLPLPQLDGRATLWELATARLTKQIKAGTNAGLPTALSALISLYLGQAIVASEDEIESFLSPLAARSRIRDVVHALIAARQLDTVAVAGRTMLHVAGAVPAFVTEELPVAADADAPDIVDEFAAVEADTVHSAGAESDAGQGQIVPPPPGSRIAKFVPHRKAAAGDLSKAKAASSSRKPFGAPRKPFGEKRPFAPRGGGERRPLRDARPPRPFGEPTGFKRRERSGGPERGTERRGDVVRRPRPESEGRPRFEKKRFSPRDAAPKPRFERRERPGASPDRERRPFVRKEGTEARPPRRPFDRSAKGREERKPFERGNDARGARKPYSKPNRFGPKKDFASSEDRPRRDFKPRSFAKRADSGEGEKSGARSFGSKRPFTKSGSFGKKPGGFSKPFRGKERDGERSERPPRSASGFGAKKFGAGTPGGARFGGRPGSKFGPKSGGASFGAKSRGGKPSPGKFGAKKFSGKKPFGKSTGPRGPRPLPGDSGA